MKRITYEDWFQQFDVNRDVEADPCDMSDDEKEALTFYSNGSVANADGDFIIKADQVRGRL